MRRRLGAFVWPVLVVAGAASPLVAILASGRTLAWRDTAQLYAPLRAEVVRALRALQLPAWNPWEATGQPLFAQGLHFVLHPLSLATAPFSASVDVLIVAAVGCAALGTWVAARELGVSRAAAAGGAWAFALSGYVLAMSANLLYLIGAASGPWAVAGWIAAAGRPRGWLAAALAIAALALSGDVGALVAFNVVGAVLAWQLGRRRGLAAGASGAALGLGLAAVQLVPSWAYLAETTRGAGVLDPGSVSRWALAPWRILELVVPGFLVSVPTSYVAPVYAELARGADRFPFASSVFVGAPVVLLAAAGARRTPGARALALVSAALLWISLGTVAGAQQLLSWVPVWGVLRYWEKMVGPLAFCLALSAAVGIDILRRSDTRATARAAAVGSFVAAMTGLALEWVAPALDTPVTSELARAHLQVGALHAAVALGGLAAALQLGKRWSLAVPVGCAAVLLLEGFAASPFALHAGDRRVLAVRPPRLDAAPPGPRVLSPLGFDFVAGTGDLDAIDLLQYWEARTARPATNVAAGIDSIATYTGLTSGRWESILAGGDLFWPLARRFGTTHVLAPPPSNQPERAAIDAAVAGAHRSESWDGGRVLGWEIPHRPWASFASAVHVAPDPAAAAAALGEEIQRGGEAVVLEARETPSVAPGRVIAISRAPEELRVDAIADADGVLVLDDAFSNGWRAWLDGHEIDVMPADLLVRAVRWPAGRHQLVMRYRPPGVIAGLVVSVVALATLLALGLLRSHPAGSRPRVPSPESSGSRGAASPRTREAHPACAPASRARAPG